MRRALVSFTDGDVIGADDGPAGHRDGAGGFVPDGQPAEIHRSAAHLHRAAHRRAVSDAEVAAVLERTARDDEFTAADSAVISDVKRAAGVDLPALHVEGSGAVLGINGGESGKRSARNVQIIRRDGRTEA